MRVLVRPVTSYLYTSQIRCRFRARLDRWEMNPFVREMSWVVACMVAAGMFVSLFPWHGMAWYFSENGSFTLHLETVLNVWRYGVPGGIIVYAITGVLRLMGNRHRLKR